MERSDDRSDVKADSARGEGVTSAGLTRRAFLAKAGLAAGAVGLAATVPTLASGCGSTSSSSSSSAAAAGEPTVVRFVFAPDPVWNFMKDTGIVAKWEELYNFKIVNTTTWDETAWFVGGHADIASMGSYEVPFVAENAGREFVSFGVYNLMRDSIFVRSDSPYKTMEDLKGQRISTAGTGASMLMYAAMFKKVYGVDLRLGGGDYKVNVQEFTAMPAALSKGQAEASFGLIDFEIPYVKSGEHRWLYPDQPTGYEWYQTYLDKAAVRQVACNLWVTTPEWLAKNPKAAEGFNLMWQEGVNSWYGDKEGIIRAYPDLFTTTNDAEVNWFLNYLNEDGGMHDQCVKTVYIDKTWAENETAVFRLLKEQGFVKQTTPDPKFAIMASPASAPPEARPPSASPSASPSA